MNVFDRMIAAFAPEAGLRRVAARHALAQVRAYDGASVGRRTQNWSTPGGSANDAIRGKLPRLVNRSRDLMRNTWWGPRIRSVFTAHAVGTGIVPTPKTGNKALDRRAAALWREWGKVCDADGQSDINGLMALACGAIIESGEVLLHRVPTKFTPGAKAPPLELRLLEPDHLDGSRDRIGADAVVDQGIEYGADGKRRAFWLLPQHPGNRGYLGVRGTSVRVANDNVLHVYRKDRIGQGRGVPWVAPIILKGRDVADLEEAITVKARVEACLAVFVRSGASPQTLAQVATDKRPDGTARRLETLSPGMINYLGQGEDIAAVTPSSGLAFDSVLINTWMTLAAGAGLTFDQLTGDLRQANYSSLRAGKIEFRRLVEQFQWLTLVPMFLDRIWGWFVEAAQDAGQLPRRASGYPVEWIMPAVEPIDPLKDLQADVLAVRTGRMTWNQFVAAWGFDPDQQLDEIASWLQALDDKKVALDVDPRRGIKGVKGTVTDTSDPQEETPRAAA